MIKAIFARDIMPGDVIDLNNKTRVTVRGTLTGEHVAEAEIFIHVFTEPSGQQHLFRPGSIIGLVHRPWLEGKTNSDMLQAIATAAFEVHSLRGYTIGLTAIQRTPPELQKAIDKLREAIEAYELGKKPLHSEYLFSKR